MPLLGLLLKPLHQSSSHPDIDNTTNTIRRHNLAHARETARDIVPPDPSHAIRPRQTAWRLPVVQIQTEQVHGRAEELH